MRAGFVLTTVAIALAFGIIAGISESRLVVRALIVGIVPTIWGMAHILERLNGRDMWHFRAPYPYTRTRGRQDTQMLRHHPARKRVAGALKTDSPSTRRVAA